MSGSESSSQSVFSRTVGAIRVVFRRTDSQLVVLASLLGYLVVYLFAVGDLALTGRGSVSLFVVSEPFEMMTRPMGFGRFQPIARLEFLAVTLLFSPINTGIAVLLAGLVAINFGLTYLGWVQPKACGLEASSGVFAGIPALLSGAACCGPVVLLVLGIQATGALITTFQWLVPVAVVLLVGSLLLIGRQVDPTLL
ncbi:MAG: hypothetical protein SVG88_03075 [Halobacteriales archaeon]|nr:hypothetical protein [Halobacteriales archaeon]